MTPESPNPDPAPGQNDSPADVSSPGVWQQLPNESSFAYTAFTTLFQMGSDASPKDVAEKLGSTYSTEELPEVITDNQALVRLNTDFSLKGLTSQELQAIVAAWQNGAISRDTMFELFRKGEILPDGRTNEEESSLLGNSLAFPKERPGTASGSVASSIHV